MGKKRRHHINEIIDNKEIKTNSIKLLGIRIDNQLRFNERISILCSKVRKRSTY